jgi:hypothetical protein
VQGWEKGVHICAIQADWQREGYVVVRIQGNAFTPVSTIKAATELLMEWTRRFLGGQERLLYAPW